MAGNVKNNKDAVRYTVLIDRTIYREARALARSHGMRWYQFLNRLLAKEVGRPFPEYLKHVSQKDD